MHHKLNCDSETNGIYVGDLDSFNQGRKKDKGKLIGVFPSLVMEERLNNLAKTNKKFKADIVRSLCAHALDQLDKIENEANA